MNRVAPCGTDSGYRRHRRTGETACADCRAAHSRYEVGRRAMARQRHKAARLRKLLGGRDA